MVIVYDAGLLVALLIGAAIGLLVTAAHYEQIAVRQWAYEKEVAECREFYAAFGAHRRAPARSWAGQRGGSGTNPF